MHLYLLESKYLIRMYHQVGISKLSPSQLSRLCNGHQVHVKIDGSHILPR